MQRFRTFLTPLCITGIRSTSQVTPIFFCFFFFLSVSQAQAGVFIFFNRFESEIFLGYSGEYALLLNLFLRLLIAKYNQI